MKKNLFSFISGLLIGALLLGGGTAVAANGRSVTGMPQELTIFVNGEPVTVEAVNVADTNYIKLRDTGEAVGFNVWWDGEVRVDTSTPYTGEAPKTLANGKPVTEANVTALLREIEKDWPTGTLWTNPAYSSATHKNEVPGLTARRLLLTYGVSSTYGCGGFAAMVSSLVFGNEENPFHRVEDLTQIRPGDMILWVENGTGVVNHVVIALDTPDAGHRFNICDGNHGGEIVWPDPASPYSALDNLDCYTGDNSHQHLEVWTRYPEGLAITYESIHGWMPEIDY